MKLNQDEAFEIICALREQARKCREIANLFTFEADDPLRLVPSIQECASINRERAKHCEWIAHKISATTEW